MKQAIQLEIPFDVQDVAGSASVQPAAADAAELRMLAAVRSAAKKSKAALPSLVLVAQAAACVAFGISLFFISAIIGG